MQQLVNSVEKKELKLLCHHVKRITINGNYVCVCASGENSATTDNKTGKQTERERETTNEK